MAQSFARSPNQLARKRLSKPDYDSPSKQLFKDLEVALQQIQLHEVEEHKVRAYERRSFYGYLDQLDEQRASVDFAALDAATARHNAIRQEAEKELHEYYKNLEEEERKRREEEERRVREKQAREKAERERREREEAEKREAARRAKEEADREADRKAAEARANAEAEERARKEREHTAALAKAERERKEKDEADKKAGEEKEKKEADERAKAAQVQAAPTPARPAPGATSLTPQLEAHHKRYLEIHRKLKEFRHTFWDECKKNKAVKEPVGDFRRLIKASVGQLVETTAENPMANRQPTTAIRDVLDKALRLQTPPVKLADFLLEPNAAGNVTTAPSTLIYCLSIFSKAIVFQLSNESGVNPKAAEPAGILVATIFANPSFHPATDVSLIDIILAKLHAACPVLFGILPGPNAENTLQGRQRLGWRQENKTFIATGRHYERVTGIGAGFASITLRNFSKSKNKAPVPPPAYWQALANILNTPPQQVQPTHLLVLKGMLENTADRFVTFYSTAAVAALRRALKDFPQSLPESVRKSPACNSLMLLPETLKRDKNFSLFE